MPPIEISVDGVAKQLFNLNVHKASGPDQISARFLKECYYIIAPTLSLIFQLSLETGTIPDDWKKAYVTPIFKSGNRTCTRNYRPISLTSIISKVMEHILASNIMHHLDVNFILSETQHGFRHSRSCETQLTSLLYDLT